MSHEEQQSNERSDQASIEPTLSKIRDALRGLRYGSLNLIIQDGIVIQMDRVEKIRLRKPAERE